MIVGYNVAECAGSIEPNATDLATHEKCISEYQEREIAKTMIKTITIVVSTIGGIILFCGVCYMYYRWQSFDDDENKNIKNDLKSEKVNAHLLTKNNEYIN